jgi:hypothetical protein
MSMAGDQPAAAANQDPDPGHLKASFAAIQQNFKELIDYGRYYLELRWDHIKLTVVQYALLALLAIAGAALVATLLIAGGIVLVIGFCYSLAEWLFDGNAAFGLLLGGALITVPVLAAIATAVYIVRGQFAAGLGKKYEHKKQEQRARYGHDVKQRAAAPAA